MKLPPNIKFYGDPTYRDKNCRQESSEQKEFFGMLKEHRRAYWEVAIHPKNEGKRTYAQATSEEQQGALNKGAVDIIIPVRVPFVCEMKRVDYSLRKLTKDQIAYLENAQSLGAFACCALGSAAAWQALLEWEEKYLFKWFAECLQNNN